MEKLEIKRLLEKQLKFLSEQSIGFCSDSSLAELTCQMVRLVEVLLGPELTRDSADEVGEKLNIKGIPTCDLVAELETREGVETTIAEQSQKHIAIGKKGQRAEILMKAKELAETKDQKEALEKLQSGNWVAVNAIYKGEDIYWCLIRIS